MRSFADSIKIDESSRMSTAISIFAKATQLVCAVLVSNCLPAEQLLASRVIVSDGQSTYAFYFSNSHAPIDSVTVPSGILFTGRHFENPFNQLWVSGSDADQADIVEWRSWMNAPGLF